MSFFTASAKRKAIALLSTEVENRSREKLRLLEGSKNVPLSRAVLIRNTLILVLAQRGRQQKGKSNSPSFSSTTKKSHASQRRQSQMSMTATKDFMIRKDQGATAVSPVDTSGQRTIPNFLSSSGRAMMMMMDQTPLMEEFPIGMLID